MNHEVIVLGDVALDVVCRAAGPVAAGSDVAAATLLCGGGAGGNLAAWLAAAKAPVHLIARVGDDATGAGLAAELHALDVTPHFAVDPQRPTGIVVVLVDDHGERTMLPDRGANLALTPADIPAALFIPGRHLHLAGYTLFGTPAAAQAALSLARAAGMTVSVDPSSTAPLRAFGPERFLAITAGADLLLPNAAEAEALTAIADPAGAAHALAGSYHNVVVTGGAGGAWWTDGTAKASVTATPVEVVNTVGCGDAFAAGFLHAWLAGVPPPEALAAGAELAARAAQLPGARPG